MINIAITTTVKKENEEDVEICVKTVKKKAKGKAGKEAKAKDKECDKAAQDVFNVASLLDPNTHMGKQMTHPVSIDELKRRCGPPENMAMRHLLTYVRTGGQNRQNLKGLMDEKGIDVSSKSALLTSYSRLTEGDGASLVSDLRKLLANPDIVAVQDIADDHAHIVTSNTSQLEQFRTILRGMFTAIEGRSQSLDLATHSIGLGIIRAVVDLFEDVIQKELTNSITMKKSAETPAVENVAVNNADIVNSLGDIS